MLSQMLHMSVLYCSVTRGAK